MAKILVADDNSNVQKTVGLALTGMGVTVVAVNNGEAAVRKLAEFMPDLVLADIFMPVRSGYEVCEYIKKDARFARVPVVLLVGAFDPFDEREAQRVGADGILKKPFVPPDPLISMVKMLLERSVGARAVLAGQKVPAVTLQAQSPMRVAAEFNLRAVAEEEIAEVSHSVPEANGKVAFGHDDTTIAFGQLLMPVEPAVQDEIAAPSTVDNAHILTGSRDAILGEPAFWRTEVPEGPPASGPHDSDLSAQHLPTWGQPDAILPGREPESLLPPVASLQIAHESAPDTANYTADYAADHTEDRAASEISESLAAKSPETPLWPFEDRVEEVAAPAEPVPDHSLTIFSGSENGPAAGNVEPLLEAASAIEADAASPRSYLSESATALPDPDHVNVSEGAVSDSHNAPALLEGVEQASDLSGSFKSDRLAPEPDVDDGKRVQEAPYIQAFDTPDPELPPTPALLIDEHASGIESSDAESSQGGSMPAAASEDLNTEYAEVHAGRAKSVEVTGAENAAAFHGTENKESDQHPPTETASSRSEGPPSNAEMHASSLKQPSSPDPALVEAVVQRVLEKMSPQVIDIITREFLRPVVQALVRREIEKL